MKQNMIKLPKKEIARIIVELYKEFSNALIEAEKKGRGHYSYEDFISLESFLKYLDDNY